MKYTEWKEEIDKRSAYYDKLYGREDFDFSTGYDVFESLEKKMKKGKNIIAELTDIWERFQNEDARTGDGLLDNIAGLYLDGCDDLWTFMHELMEAVSKKRGKKDEKQM
jgi:hypothetical protein